MRMPDSDQTAHAVAMGHPVRGTRPWQSKSGQSEMLIRSISDYAIYMLDLDGYVASWNIGAELIKGYAATEIIGRHFSVFFTEEDQSAGKPKRALQTALRDGKYGMDGCWSIRKDGSAFWASVVIEPMRGPDGTLLGFAKVTRDMSEQKLVEVRLLAAHEQLASLFRHAAVGLVQIYADLRFAVVNDAFCQIVGRPREELLHLSVMDILLPEHRNSAAGLVETVQRTGEGIVAERRYLRPNGSTVDCRISMSGVPDEEGRPLKVIGVVEDITERKRAKARLNHLAFHDDLTGLANRALLNDRLSQELQHIRPDSSRCAVLALGLDHLNTNIKTFGRDVGDALLRLVATRLRKVVRAVDTVARVGTDEFVILQTDAPQPESATVLARQLIQVLAQPFDVDRRSIVVSGSIGIAFHDRNDHAEASLLQKADIALLHAKSSGGGTFSFFEPAMEIRQRERRELEHDLRLAIGTDQIRLNFQPQFACTSGILTGFEALLRWHHPLRGQIAPMDFIPIAEETHLIIPLGLWAMEQACIAAMSWTRPLRVAVNLSLAQFRGGGLPTQIKAILRRTGLAPERLEVELTETLLADDSGLVKKMLFQLKKMGISVALDDFGTGYSSLSYLHRFPFDKIKIDKSFVQALGRDPSTLPLVQAILAMGQALGIEVIAEGVETDDQLRILRDHKCAQVQGFLLGRPMPPENIGPYLDPGHSGSPLLASGQALTLSALF